MNEELNRLHGLVISWAVFGFGNLFFDIFLLAGQLSGFGDNGGSRFFVNME